MALSYNWAAILGYWLIPIWRRFDLIGQSRWDVEAGRLSGREEQLRSQCSIQNYGRSCREMASSGQFAGPRASRSQKQASGMISSYCKKFDRDGPRTLVARSRVVWTCNIKLKYGMCCAGIGRVEPEARRRGNDRPTRKEARRPAWMTR